jgi:K+-transporting ATPase ATPase B chain
LKKLTPQDQFFKPVMFVTYLGAILTTLIWLQNWWQGYFSFFELQIALWLWFTVFFANCAEALAESRGKAQAQSLKTTQESLIANRMIGQTEEKVPATALRKGDIVVCREGETIPADGEVIKGIASVDESIVTGESAPVIREPENDRNIVVAGTRVLSDMIVVKVTTEKGSSFLDHIITMIESAKRHKTPSEISLAILLVGLTLIFLFAVSTLKIFADYIASSAQQNISQMLTVPVLIALLVCLIPTTISGLLSAIGIAGMDRLARINVIAKSGRAVEAAGNIDLMMLDKTGTITVGDRSAAAFIPAEGVTEKELAEVAQLASFADRTPEGRSIVIFAKQRYNLHGETLEPSRARLATFSAQTLMSGVDVLDADGVAKRVIRKGAMKAIQDHLHKMGGEVSHSLLVTAEGVARKGGTPLLVSDGQKAMGIIVLKDVVKGGLRERFQRLRQMGIKTLMITGDNPLTAAAVAAESGVDDFLANATPELKLERILQEQKRGKMVAMIGDGTNDAPALAQADVGVAMNTGTQASRDAGNMVDLESNPTKLMDVIMLGKQLLITRGALTTFSIANDVAKYFAIIPAIFGVLYAVGPSQEGPLSILGIMNLHSPQSAVLSAIMFNALIIVTLIPIALKGAYYKIGPASQILKHNLLIYGLGGLIAPFLGIKMIDLLLGMLMR